jgi:hypothetical protein
MGRPAFSIFNFQFSINRLTPDVDCYINIFRQPTFFMATVRESGKIPPCPALSVFN